MTNVALAKSLGMGVSGVQKIKTMQSTSLKKLAKMCIVLECHPLDLLEMDGFTPPLDDAE